MFIPYKLQYWYGLPYLFHNRSINYILKGKKVYDLAINDGNRHFIYHYQGLQK